MLSVVRQQLPGINIMYKLVMIVLLAFLMLGITGLGVFIVMYSLSTMRIGLDLAASHGISAINSSRLGGVAIVVTFLGLLIGMAMLGPYNLGILWDATFLNLWSTIILCVLLGAVEDFRADLLSPHFRLVAKLLAFGIFLWVTPAMVPQSIGVPLMDFIFAEPAFAWALCTLFCVGFINACNMADGANGLFPGIATIVIGVLFLEYGRPAEGALLVVCLMFLIFNVISGRFFLGDTGSYGLGAVIACYGLLGVAQGDFSAGFMASLLSYPCVELLVSMTRRARKGQSPLRPDNGHLHNRLHKFYEPKFKSRVISNSMTGLTISFFSSGVCLVIYLSGLLSIRSNAWFCVLALQAVLYLIVYYRLKRTEPEVSTDAAFGLT